MGDLNVTTRPKGWVYLSERLQVDLTLPGDPHSLKARIPGPGIYKLGPVDYSNLLENKVAM